MLPCRQASSDLLLASGPCNVRFSVLKALTNGRNSGLKLNQVRDAVPWYSSKLDIRAYLEGINREETVSQRYSDAFFTTPK